MIRGRLLLILMLMLAALWTPPAATNGYADTAIGITGATVATIPISTGITTNTTSGVVDVPNGPKSFFGQVECTSGACAQTQAIYGTNYPTAVKGVLLCTMTLSGTTAVYDACPVVTAAFARYYIITTATSGTAATGAVYVSY